MDYYPPIDDDEWACFEYAPPGKPADDLDFDEDTDVFISERVEVEHNGFVRQTDKARLHLVGDREVWLPKSLAKLSGRKLTVPRWVATKNGLKVIP